MKSKSRKGKISGSARKEINASRVSKILEQGEGYLFARVVKHLGMGRVEVNIATPRGAVKTLRAQIPLVFSRKGATPINSTTVVSIFAGKDFDSEKEIDPKTHFKIEAILKDSEAYDLKEDGRIPAWMTARTLAIEGTTAAATAAAAKAVEEEGWEFAREEDEEDKKKEEDAEGDKKRAASSKHVEMADFDWE
jgi:hypothetical protein